MATMDDAAVKHEVDQYFSDVNQSLFLQTHGTGSHNEIPPGIQAEVSPAVRALKDENWKLTESDYAKFADALVKDPRLQQVIPYLAVDALLNGKLGKGDGTLDVGQDLAQMSGMPSPRVTKDFIAKAAEDQTKFDPVYRQALKYVVDNYDKFRNADPHDGLISFSWIGGDDNSSEITGRDARAAQKQIQDYLQTPDKERALDTLIQNFGAIDTEHAGYITAKETENWVDSERQRAGAPSFSEQDFFSSNEFLWAMPKLTDRQLPDSEHITLADLQKKKDELLAHSRQIRESWGLPDNHQ